MVNTGQGYNKHKTVKDVYESQSNAFKKIVMHVSHTPERPPMTIKRVPFIIVIAATWSLPICIFGPVVQESCLNDSQVSII